MPKYSIIYYKEYNSLELFRDDLGNQMAGKVIYTGTNFLDAMSVLIDKAKELKLTPEFRKDISVLISDRAIIDGFEL